MNSTLLGPLTRLLSQMSLAFPDPRPRPMAVDLGLGWLCALGPKTVTAALQARGRADQDWSEAYPAGGGSRPFGLQPAICCSCSDPSWPKLKLRRPNRVRC